MTADALTQSFLLTAQAVAVCGLLLAFFSLRHRFGYAPLYVTLGGFQHLQTLLAKTLYIEVFPGIVVSPGSVVLFTATLFAVLLVYIREDTAQTRSLIVGIVAANLTLSLVVWMTTFHLGSDLLVQTGFASEHLLQWSLQAFVVGTVTLIVDAFLIVVLYEYFYRLFPRLLFARIFAAMFVVVVIDTLLFVTASFYGSTDFTGILASGVIGKASAALIYTFLLSSYLRWARSRAAGGHGFSGHADDIFHILTYKQRFELLEEEIKRDGLTGLFNRRFFDENLRREMGRADRLAHELNLALIDIDHFKSINDSYGHQVGDQFIQALADSMQAAFRAADIPCRYGGEEFAIIMPDCPVEGASRATERLQAEFSALCKARGLPGADGVTFTAGIANYPADADTAVDLIERADQRLYKGKRHGRNRVMLDTVRMSKLAMS
ncbi:MAG: diguanylate cyclase [Gammaproteobacteria bacterium]|nr:diguanylate cyclase [Gammaproteobacteria bacterium]NNF49339.1 diguanylate cyclase [Woeseiaceae bacterium]MBT8094924.1 diguanylate cyclase [Gammaproteobacteria bacterium]MBT8106448.1 diguanylate cyclase [Gammaproteobacteria bacterium]NNK26463.1 diguanylate cyclase [Woeseiaceae bacterium]